MEAEVTAAMADSDTITVEPIFAAAETTFTVTVAYSGIGRENDVYANVTSGSFFTLTAATIDGLSFTGWELDGVMVSNCETLKLTITADTTVTAVYSAVEVDKVPMSVITYTGAEASGTKNIITVSETYSVPDGYTVCETGLLRTTDASGGTADNLILENVGSYSIKKHTSSNQLSTGEFTLNLNVGTSTGVKVYFRGFVTVLDAGGNQVTFYSEIFSASYFELA